MEIEAQYQELETRRQAAFSAFKRIYELEMPPPEKPVQQAKRDRLMRGALLLVVVGSLIVSASHTVSVFSHGKSPLVGVAAFLMLESGAVSLGFYQAREKYQSRDVDTKHMLRYMTAGVWLAVLVMASGNVQDVFVSAGFAEGGLWVVINFVISGAVALSAPLMVLIVSHVLAMLYVKDAGQDKRAELDYEEKLRGWNDDMLRSWQAQKARYGASVNIQVDRPVISNGNSNGIPLENIPVLPSKSSIGHSKQPQASKIAREFFQANPQELDGDAIEIAGRIGVGKSTVYAIMKELKG